MAMAPLITMASTPQFSLNFNVEHTAMHRINRTIIVDHKIVLKLNLYLLLVVFSDFLSKLVTQRNREKMAYLTAWKREKIT